MLQLSSIIRRVGFLLLILPFSTFAQSYRLTSQSGTYIPLSGGTNVGVIQADDAISSPIDIGFSFVFYGVSYTQVKASSNGFLSFGLNTNSGSSNSFTSGYTSLRPLIAPLWDDLDGTSGTATYKLEGTSPNRVFTFEWLNWMWNYEASSPVISFQVKLYESTNVIEYVYRSESGAVNNGSASIGLSISTPSSAGKSNSTDTKSSSNAIFFSLSDASVQPTLSSTIATNNIATKPADGQTYIFDQVVLPEPTNHATSFTANSNYKKITLNWIDAIGSTTPDGYLIYASTTNDFTDPIDFSEIVEDNDLSDGNAKVIVDKGVQSYSNFTNLQYNNTYYFRIYSFTNSGSYIDYKISPQAPQTSLQFLSKAEPTSNATSLKASSNNSNIILRWTDAIDAVTPDAYLILVSETNSFVNPVDNTEPAEDLDLSDGVGMAKVQQGVQTFSGFTNLQASKTYYFKIFSFTNQGSVINFKTDGAIPQTLVYYSTTPSANNVLSFDGANDYVDLGTVSPIDNFSKGFTYMGWVKFGAFTQWERLFDFGLGMNSNNILLTVSSTSGSLTFDNRIGSTVYPNATGNVLQLNQWVHIAATISATGVSKVYINGSVVATASGVAPANVVRTSCYLGKSNWTGDPTFNGSMDEVSFWTRDLSQAEIQSYIYSVPTGNELNLYAYYKFDQGTGFISNQTVKALNDASANAINGSLNNFTLDGTSSNWLPRTTESNTNNCLSFDGTDDFVTCGAINPTSFTLEAWINPSVVNKDMAIFSTLGETSPYLAGCELHISATGNPVLTVRNSSTFFDIISSTALQPNTWVHVAATFNGTTGIIYVNGIQVATGTTTSFVAGSNIMMLGKRSVALSNYNLNGKIDECRIWNVVRSQSDISNNMLKSLSNPTSIVNLVAYYKMNQGVADGDNRGYTSLADASSGNKTGLLTNFSLTGTTSNWSKYEIYSKTLSNYIFTPINGSFTPLTGATTMPYYVSNAIPLGFTFNFNGTNYTQVYACLYGWLSFNPTKPSPNYNNDNVPSNASALPFLAPLWDCFKDDNSFSRCNYKSEGTAPNRVFTFEWLNFAGVYITSAQFSFQVKLYETSNRIEYIYRQESQPAQNNNFSIGYYFADGSYYVLNNTSTTPDLSTINYCYQSQKPATGQIYRLEPVLKGEPTNYPSNIRATGGNGYITLNWTDAVGDQCPDGYYIVASKTGTFVDLVDGSEPTIDNDLSDGKGVVKVAQGVQTYSDWKFSESSDSWYFRFYPYVNSGSSINYKNSAIVAQATITLPHYLFTERTDISFSNLCDATVAWGDYSKDGNLDFVFAGNDHNTFVPKRYATYKNNGDKTFTSNINIDGAFGGSIAWADYDNDGDLDFVISGAETEDESVRSTKIYRYDSSTGTFSSQADIPLIGVTKGALAWVDYDNDGFKDLLVSGVDNTFNAVTKLYHNNGNNSFTESVQVLPGVAFGTVVWGDYNNDGYNDLLIIGSQSGTIISDINGITKLYKNNGNGTFSEQTDINLPQLGWAGAAWGDYDNDGDLDLLIEGFGAAKLFRNDGGNIFSEQKDFQVGSSTLRPSVALVDYDNDGHLDAFLTANGTTLIYKNNGDGTFTLQSNYSIAKGVKSFGDYDKDGDLDLLVADDDEYSGYPAQNRLYSNNSQLVNTVPSVPTNLRVTQTKDKVTFSWDQSTDNSTPTSAITYSIRIGTSTGACDILSAQALDNGTLLVPGRGNIGAKNSFSISLQPGTYFWSVQAVDNSYGGSAFASEQSFARTAYQATNLSATIRSNSSLMLRWVNGNFSRRAVFCKQAYTGTASPVNGISYAADPYFGKGDQVGSSSWYCVYNGKADSVIVYGLSPTYGYMFHVVEYSSNAGSPDYLTTTANGNPGLFGVAAFMDQPSTITSITDNLYNGTASWVDYNNDGYLDFYVGGNGANLGLGTTINSFLYTNNGDNTFTKQSIFDSSWAILNVAWGDYDNDGFKDALVMCDTMHRLSPTFNETYYFTRIYKNVNGDHFELQDISNIAPANEGSIKWFDYNNDGLLDIVLTGQDKTVINNTSVSYTKIFKNNGNNSFSDLNLQLPGGKDVDFGDYDNDGDLDIAIVGRGISKIYRNDNGAYNELISLNIAQLSKGSVGWGDFNNDGLLDLVLVGDNNFFVYKNEGNGELVLQSQVNKIENDNDCNLKLGDYNNDGYLDILVSNEGYGGTKIYKNNRDFTFSEVVNSNLVNAFQCSVDWGDFDNDGDLDIILIGRAGTNQNDAEFTKLYTNNTVMKSGVFSPNNAPVAPANLNKELLRGGMLLRWDPVLSDETPSKTMSYNIRIGTSKTNLNLYAPHYADNVGVQKRTLEKNGNTGLNTFAKVFNLPDLPNNGYYYWQVQAVDGGYKGGVWSKLDSLQIKAAQAYFTADEVCLHSLTSFTDNSVAYDGIVAWQWDFGDTTYSTLQNPTHEYIYPGNHKVRLVVSNLSGKTDTIFNIINVKPIPRVSFTASDVCSGTTTTIVNTTSIASIVDWNWNFGDNQTSVYANPASHVYSSEGNYTITLKVKANNNCYAETNQDIVVTTTPNATLSLDYGSPTFCKGDSVQFSVQHSSNYNYQWTRDGEIIPETTSVLKVKNTSGSYKVVVVNSLANSCRATSVEKLITVKNVPSSPVLTSENATTFCMGDSTKLSAGTYDGVTYQWLRNEGLLNNSLSYMYAKESGSYSLRTTYSNGCFSIPSNSVTVTVNSKPTLPSLSYGETNVCKGSSVNFSVPGNSQNTYQWYNGNELIQGATSNSYSADKTGVYSLQVTNPNSCSVKTDVVNVTINEVPTKPIISEVSNNTLFCPGTEVELSVKDPVSKYGYQWKRSGIPIDGATSSNYKGKLTAGDYRVEVLSGNCSAESEIITLNTKAAPAKPNIYAWGPNVWIISCDNSTASDYRWYYNDQLVVGAKSSQYVAKQNLGNYYVEINEGGECYTMSDIINIPTGNIVNGVDDFSENSLSVFPNPTKGKVWIALNGILADELSVELFDALGNLLESHLLRDSNGFSIDLSNYSKGIYLCRIGYKDTFVVKKIVKE